MSEHEGDNCPPPMTPVTPGHVSNSLDVLMGNRLKTPSMALYSTPKYDVPMNRVGVKQSEYASQMVIYWKGRINTTNRDMFLPNVSNVLGKKVVCDLYDRAVATLNTIHINNLIIDDVNKLTMAVYNSVLSSLMEDEISRGVNNTTSLLLSNVSFTYSVLALSFDTAVYLLINNQFDIVSRLSTFGVTPFDIQRILERFIDKLNQQSSYLVNGDVRAHYNKILETIVDVSIWKEDSVIWKYLHSNINEKIPVAVEVFIRNLLYFSYTHIKDTVSHLDLSEANRSVILANAWKLMKYVIQHRLYLFKNRNTSCILICCIFGVAKSFKLDVTFVQLLNAFGLLYPSLIQRAKYDILMKIDEIVTGYDQDRGNIIDFYNNIFVIANNEFLVQMKNNIGDCRNSIDSMVTSSQDHLTVHENIIKEAKSTLSTIREGGERSNSIRVSSRTVSVQPSTNQSSSIANDRSLDNTEEQVKDVLINLASFSPTRTASALSPRDASPVPSSVSLAGRRSSPALLINYQLRSSSTQGENQQRKRNDENTPNVESKRLK